MLEYLLLDPNGRQALIQSFKSKDQNDQSNGLIVIVIAASLLVIGIVLTVCYCIKEKRKERKELEERNRHTQYGSRIYDDIAPGQAVDPHNFADENGFGN